MFVRNVVGQFKVPAGYESWLDWWQEQYTLRLDSKEQRDTLQIKLKEQSVLSMVYYPTPMHAQATFANIGSVANDSSLLSKTVLSLPMHPYMTDEDILPVVDAIKVSL